MAAYCFSRDKKIWDSARRGTDLGRNSARIGASISEEGRTEPIFWHTVPPETVEAEWFVER